jgi:20S proteasome alpha/beta subunit
VSGTSSALESLEASFQQDVNADGTIGLPTTVIEVSGSTGLRQVGDNFYLGASGPQLKYAGSAVAAGQFGGWSQIGAEATSNGYEVAWKLAGSNVYTVWSTDSNGNYSSNIIGAVSGTSSALESLEASFQQDLNADGVIGLPTTVIETFGSTSLRQVGDNFYLGASGPQLKYAGAVVTAGQFGGWTQIGAEATSNGYEVAWKLAGSNVYSVWSTDSSGSYTSNLIGAVSGTNTTLESLEASFQQDLNADGIIGLRTTVIEAFGSTSLIQVGDNFYLGASGLQLKYAGIAVAAGQFGGWSQIGAEATANGYEVAWKLAGSNQYTVWNTDSSGNYTSNTAVVAGTNTNFESLETNFHQDLNGDGTIGLPASGISAASVTPSAPIVVSSGANVEITSIYAGAVTFTDSTGTLKLDHASSFAGTVAGMGAQDTLDLADINFATLQQPIFSGNTSGGMLNVTDGTHTANIALLGNYMASTFVTSSDGHGGTYIVDTSVASQTTLAQPLHA